MKLAKKAEEIEIKAALKLHEQDMEIYRLECEKAELTHSQPPPKPIGPKEVEEAEAELAENKRKFNELCPVIMDMFRRKAKLDAALIDAMNEGKYQ